MEFVKHRVGVVTFCVASIEQAVANTIRNVKSGSGQNLRFSNAYCVGLASQDSAYRHALSSPGYNFADGFPVAWFLRVANGRTMPLEAFRVRGPSFFEQVIADGCDHGLRHSFIGATPSTLERLVDWVNEKYPAAVIAGVYAPKFAPLDDEFIESICVKIEEQNPQIVWLGLGTPKQDLTAERLALRYPNLTFASVGAAFDFKAGVVVEAPRWIQQVGMEWIFRLASQPRRLWRRYTVGNFVFLRSVLVSKPWSKDLKRKY